MVRQLFDGLLRRLGVTLTCLQCYYTDHKFTGATIEEDLYCFSAPIGKIFYVRLALPPLSVHLEVGSMLSESPIVTFRVFPKLRMETHGCLHPPDAEAANRFIKLGPFQAPVTDGSVRFRA